MKVSDILRVKGNALYTVPPDTTLFTAITIMAKHDIGSLVVMDNGELVGMLTFYELLKNIAENQSQLEKVSVRAVMNSHPVTCTTDTEMNEVQCIMLTYHARYLPVLENRTLMGVISFYDVAKAIVEAQDFENKMLKAYIHDWPIASKND